MTLVHTRDEAIRLVDSAVVNFDRQITAVLDDAVAAARIACGDARAVVDRCQARVDALVELLRSVDEWTAQAIHAELVREQANLERARRASTRVSEVAIQTIRIHESYLQWTSGLVAEARSVLSGRLAAIVDYHGGSGSPRGLGGPLGAHSGSNLGGPDSPVDVFGLSNVDVMSADLADNPIVGSFGRGGATRADYRWAVQTWSDTVGPGISLGMSRSDFEARDVLSGAPPFRRTADVYDMFLGDGHIRVNQQKDGSLNIINGRHRLQIARDLGIQSLPGRVYE